MAITSMVTSISRKAIAARRIFLPRREAIPQLRAHIDTAHKASLYAIDIKTVLSLTVTRRNLLPES